LLQVPKAQSPVAETNEGQVPRGAERCEIQQAFAAARKFVEACYLRKFPTSLFLDKLQLRERLFGLLLHSLLDCGDVIASRETPL